MNRHVFGKTTGLAREGQSEKPSGKAVLKTGSTGQGKPCCLDIPIPLTSTEAARLQLDPAYWVRGRRVLARKPNGCCHYLTAEGCRIWPERPGVCRVYPDAETEGQPSVLPPATVTCPEK